MNYLLKLLETDKAKHFIGGYLISLTFSYFGFYTPGLIVSSGIGIAKEIWDKYNPPHQCDWKDALATICGGLLAYTFYFVK